MSQISLKSILGITSITTPAGVDNVFTVHTNDTTERFRVDQTGNLNIAGIITATSFSGDGSNLTGITQTTINNNADNKLITGSGSANTLNAESDITYDGTKLNIASGKYFNTSSPYRVADHPVLGYDSFTDISGGSYATRLGSTGTSTLRSTQIYGGGSHLATFDGVNFRLGLRTTTPAKDLHVYNPSVATVRIETGDSRGQAWDILSTNGAQNNTGTLSFRDESGSAYLEFGANEGSPQFRVRNGGANDLLHIDNSGRVKSPYQPSFYATANSGGTISMTSTHILTNWRLSTSGKTYNIGGHFNTSNGRFTAPVSGIYLFTASILLSGYDQASGIHMIWRKNGSNFQYWYNTRTSDIDRSGYGGYLAQGSTTTFNLSANDYIEVACNFNGSLSLWCGDANWGHFSGHLLG